MTQAKPQFTTIGEFLSFDGGDRRYELVRGELVEMPNESTLNTQIAMFLITMFLQLGIPHTRLGIKQMISVSSTEVTARDPDLIVHSDASIAAIAGKTRALISADLPAPMLVVEIVSPGNPGSENYDPLRVTRRDRDYIEKRREYALRGIPEYWLIDPNRSVILVLTLAGSSYQEREFRNSDRILSQLFPALNQTAAQILSAGQ